MNLDETVEHLKSVIKKRLPKLAERLSATRSAISERVYRSKFPMVSKTEFIRDLARAIQNKQPYATGKIGVTTQYMMNYPIVLGREKDPKVVNDYASQMEFMCLKQQGIFPYDLEFLRGYIEFYVEQVKQMDCLGMCYLPNELEMRQYYGLTMKWIHYPNQEPDRSIPDKPQNCYVQHFAGKKLLIICPFGDLLRDRATKAIFEGVWSNTGKRWFYPQSVDSLEFPYGFSSETHARFPTVFNLIELIEREIERRDFDIALIAAAGIAMPIASHVKKLGKIAIDLGGHLQFLFGVRGARWRDNPESMPYFNEHWIDMPAKYKPKETGVCDDGAYW